MRRHLSLLGIVTLAWIASASVVGEAQPGRPKAEVTPVVESSSAQAGTTVRALLNVSLPNDVHVQSDKPRDPALIPTVLTIEPPPGVTVSSIEYPTPTDLAQAGQKQPLAVFGPTFTIGVRLALAKDVGVGEVIVPARLRYQACDAKVCYPPARADAQWTLRVTK